MKSLAYFYSPLQLAAISHGLLRLLVLLMVENECARLVAISTGQPAILGNYLLSGLFGLAVVLSLVRYRVGFFLLMAAGWINVLAKVVILFLGHEHFPHRPYLYIFQSLLVVYFSSRALKEFRAGLTPETGGVSAA